MSNTTVINLVGGSGLGKSTSAAGLFYHMKLKGQDVELVSEFAKRMAWKGEAITPLNQIYVLGQQTQSESLLYGKVNTIITDSSLLLAGIYDLYYNNRKSTLETVTDFIKRSEITHRYYLLQRHKPFISKGRYETESQAKEIDLLVKEKMVELNIPYMEITCPDEERVTTIMKDLNV